MKTLFYLFLSYEQLFHSEPNTDELVIIPDETNLTKIMLNPLRRLHLLLQI